MGMPENVRRVEDYPPYQSNWDGARASTPAEIRYAQHSNGTTLTARQPYRPDKNRNQSSPSGGTAAKMAARQSLPKGAKAQSIGRARSPLRAGVGHADSASWARILLSAP